jgi:hypothetical protein
VATESIGLFIKNGVPHDKQSEVLWARILDDGFTKRKGFRVERKGIKYQDILKPIVSHLRAWVVYGTKLGDSPGELEFLPINSDELIPQAHLGTPQLNINALNTEVRNLYKNLTVQLWDQQQRIGGVIKS